MKWFPKVSLHVTRNLFRFSCGTATSEFKPEVHLSADRVILAIGNPPQNASPARVVSLLIPHADHSEALLILEMVMRHGVREVIGGWCLGPLTLRISCGSGSDVFSSDEWRQAASQAGASKIILEF